MIETNNKLNSTSMKSLRDVKLSIAEDLKREFKKSQMMKSCSNIVDSRFYQLYLESIIEDQELIADTQKSDWSKLLSDIELNSGVLRPFIKAAWNEYQGSDPNLKNIETCGQSQHGGIKTDCVMVWASSPNKTQLEKLGTLIRQTLGNDYKVVVFSSDHTSNKKVEEKIESEIIKLKRKNKKLVILSKFMGSRSFSIPEIDTTFLFYDNGSTEATAQRISRVFTGGKTYDGKKKHYGNVVSFSFDPNREDSTPLDDYIINEAEKVESDDLNKSIKAVLRSTQIFTNDPEHGIILPLTEVQQEDYVQKLVNSSSLLKVAESGIDISVVDIDDVDIDDVILDKETKNKVKSLNRKKVKRTVTLENGEERGIERNLTLEEKRRRLIREVLKSIVRNVIELDEINNIESDNFNEMLDMINQKGLDDEVIYEVGVDTRVIKRWSDSGAFSNKLLNTIINSYNEQQRQELENGNLF